MFLLFDSQDVSAQIGHHEEMLGSVKVMAC
jgi:hypothetical protein